MCIFYILKDTQTLSFLFPRKQPPNPFQLSSEQFSFHYAKMITIIQKVLPGRITSLPENNALKSTMYHYVFQKENGFFSLSLFCQLRSRTSKTFSEKTCWSVKTDTFHWVLPAFMAFLGKERRLPSLSDLFMTTVIVLGTKPSGMFIYPFFFFLLEDPALASNHSLYFHGQKKVGRKKSPNKPSGFSQKTNFSKPFQAGWK